MKKLFARILHSWKLALILLISLPLVAYGVVHWTESKYATLPYYGNNNQPANQSTAPELPTFVFTDQEGYQVTKAALKQKIVIANFFFTSCPVVCPKMMAGLQQVRQAFSKDTNLLLLSFTVDPLRDSTTTLQRYGKRLQLAYPGWRLLTGSKQSLYFFARKGLYITATDGDGGPDDFIHSEYIVLLDSHQKIRGYYKGTSADETKTLIDDIKKLQHEQ